MDLAHYLPIWSRLTKVQQKKLSDSAVERHFQRGEFLHNSAADCTGLLIVCTGQLRAYLLSEDGREITVYRLFERDICLFSASCMMNSIQFDLAIEAEKETCAIQISVDAYKQIMAESAPLANYTNEIMASRFSDVMWLIDQIMWKSFDRRLAGFLVNEAELEGTNTLHLTHETIGKHVGSPREVVTRMLKYFSDEGMVRLSRGLVELVDTEKLENLSSR